ncbi:MAG: hypothetical protein JWM78_1225 [Verrucomicrobiaceae bacterium]|nr:hypothetical protein [Verrucomicrobiaceae bacterium]
MMNSDSEIKSPCINICELDDREICLGCWRHIDEIVAWSALDDSARRAVIMLAKQRGDKSKA